MILSKYTLKDIKMEMRNLLNSVDFLITEAVQRKLYHSTNLKKIKISNKKDRLIPNSTSFSTKQNKIWGKNIFSAKLKDDAKILELDVRGNFWDITKKEVTPLDLGILWYEYAKKKGYDVIKILHVPQVGTEYAVLNLDVLTDIESQN